MQNPPRSAAGHAERRNSATVKEIEKVAEKLPPKSLSLFRNRFESFESAAWDQQFEADARSGRLDLLVNEAIDEYKTGKPSSL